MPRYVHRFAPTWFMAVFCVCLPILYTTSLVYEQAQRATAYTRNEVAAARFRRKAKRAAKKSRVSKPLLLSLEGEDCVHDPATAASATTTPREKTAATATTPAANANPKTEHGRKQPTSFLNLPWELRTRIYNLALHDGHYDRSRKVGEPIIYQIQGHPRRGPLPSHWAPGQHVRSDDNETDPPSTHLELLVRAGCTDGMRQTVLTERNAALLREHRLLLHTKPKDGGGDNANAASRAIGSNLYDSSSNHGLGFFPTAALARERRLTAVFVGHTVEAMNLKARAEKEERARREGRGPVPPTVLMRVCRAVYADLLALLYGTNTFTFFGAGVLAFFNAVASPEGVRRVRYAHLAFCVSAIGEGSGSGSGSAGLQGGEGRSRIGIGGGQKKKLREREQRLLKQRKGVEDSVSLLRAEFQGLKQLDVEIVVDAGGAGQPADPVALWRWLMGDDVLGRLKGLGLDEFVLKVAVLLDIEVEEGKRPPRLATRSVPLCAWDEDEYQALKRAVMTSPVVGGEHGGA